MIPMFFLQFLSSYLIAGFIAAVNTVEEMR